MNMVVSHILETLTNSPSGTEDNVYSSHSVFSDQLNKILSNVLKKVGYNLDIMRQSACLVVNPITAESCDFLINCMTMGKASDLMTALV